MNNRGINKYRLAAKLMKVLALPTKSIGWIIFLPIFIWFKLVEYADVGGFTEEFALITSIVLNIFWVIGLIALLSYVF